MIATILKSSKSFAAIDYNEKKRMKGDAILLEVNNFIYLNSFSDFSSKVHKQYLIDYSSKNKNIKKSQFHVAISCKGKEYNNEELLAIAHEYLKKMGYGESPTLIYAHRDTDNNHLHIVTSRVDKYGKKINDSNEKIRSQAIINKIMRVDIKSDTIDDFNLALSYMFDNINQFQAIMESKGYECFQKEGNLCIKKGGVILKEVPALDIISHSEVDIKLSREKQLKAIFSKYKNFATNEKELQQFFNKKFGIDILFFGKENNRYGYTIVDHAKKMVFKGSSILPIKNLLNFQSKESQLKNINDFLYIQLQKNPRLTIYDINKCLRRKFNIFLKNGKININGQQMNIDSILYETLCYNNRVMRAQKFAPVNEAERNVLAVLKKVNCEDIYMTMDKQKRIDGYVDNIKGLGKANWTMGLKKMGVEMIKYNSNYYFIDNKNSIIMSNEDLNLSVSDIDKLTNDKFSITTLSSFLNIGQGGNGAADGEVKKKKKKNNI